MNYPQIANIQCLQVLPTLAGQEGDPMRENLKNARKAAGLTQQQVAEYLHISGRHYKFMESGHTTGNVELWDMLEDLFKVLT